MGDKAISDTTWKELEKELFTPEEIAESDQRVTQIAEGIKKSCNTEREENKA